MNMPEPACRSKDPSSCRHHGTAASNEAGMDEAAKSRDFASYEKYRKEIDKSDAMEAAYEKATKRKLFGSFGKVKSRPSDLPPSKVAAGVAVRAQHGTRYKEMSESQKETAIQTAIPCLAAALPHIKKGVITPKAVEAYTKTQWSAENKDWDSATKEQKHISRASARWALTHALPHLDI